MAVVIRQVVAILSLNDMVAFFLSSLSLALLVTAAAWLQRVTVARCSEDCACVFLATYEGILYPRVGENLIHSRTLAGVELQHAADDVPGLTR
jgi:hypothetical protein